MKVVVEVAVERREPWKGPAHALPERLDPGEGRTGDHREGGVARRMRRSALSASRCRVASFSLTSRSLRARSHSAFDTTLGRSTLLPPPVQVAGSTFPVGPLTIRRMGIARMDTCH